MNRKTITTTVVSLAKAFCLVNGMYILKAEDSTVKQVFDYIEKHSQYVFVYDQPVKDRLNNKVNIELKGKSIDAILTEVCRLADLKYTIQNRQVTITANPSKKATTQVKKAKRISGQVVMQLLSPTLMVSFR